MQGNSHSSDRPLLTRLLQGQFFDTLTLPSLSLAPRWHETVSFEMKTPDRRSGCVSFEVRISQPFHSFADLLSAAVHQERPPGRSQPGARCVAHGRVACKMVRAAHRSAHLSIQSAGIS